MDIVTWKGKIRYKTNILMLLSQALGLEVTYCILAHLVLSLPIKTRPSVSFLIIGTVSNVSSHGYLKYCRMLVAYEIALQIL